MGKLIAGSFMFIIGLFMCFTGVGAIIGLPMFAGGLAMGAAGLASMGKTAVKTGVATGKIVREMQANRAEPAPTLTETAASVSSSVADEIAKLADLLTKGYLTQAEFDQKKAQLLGLSA